MALPAPRSQPATILRGPGRAALWLAAGLVAVALGVVAAQPLPQGGSGPAAVLRSVASIPPAALVAALAGLAMLPAALRRWELAAGALLVWLVAEDLVRKLAGNDIRVYFVKDLFFAVAVMALVRSGRIGAEFRTAVGRAGSVLAALIAWAVALSVPLAIEDWRIPLVGLRLDFAYIPLVVVGWRIASERESLVRWLVGLSVLGGLGSAVGIAQAAIGPSFLAPAGTVRGLPHLVLVRGLPQSGPVYRPTGTFVDPGRYASFVLVALAVSLAALLVTAGRRRLLVGVSAASAAAGVWLSGGRAGLLAGLGLVAAAALATPWALRRARLGRAVGATLLAAAAVAVVALASPRLFESRLHWYAQTLNPRSSNNEWSFRWNSYWGATVDGVARGGLLGQGTGRESLGKQYLT
ncbi:MAG: hypothetical protein C4344_04700, partial [Acidimicrobiia bacterium]